MRLFLAAGLLKAFVPLWLWVPGTHTIDLIPSNVSCTGYLLILALSEATHV